MAEVLRGQFERRRPWWLCGFSILYLVSTCLLASRKLMWNDELFTFYIARLPSLADMWSALSTGADQIPPFFHMITRASLSLFGVNHVSIRLPEILGFWVMSLCLFRFVSKRSTGLYGFTAMLFPLITTAYDYAYEARPYGLVLGFCALALLCWQSAAEGRRRKLSLVGLAVSFAAAISSHYYAVLLFFPLAAGEVVRSLSQRRLDLSIWGAFGFGMTPLLLFLPLIEGARTYSASFWAQPHWRSIPEFYYFLLIPAVFPLVAILILSAVNLPTPRPDPSRPNQESCAPIPIHEIGASFGFIAMPIVAVIFAKLVTGAFTYRYALPSVIGFSILLAFGAFKLLGLRAILSVALIVSFLGGFIMLQVRSLQEILAVSQELDKTYKFIQSKTESELPTKTESKLPIVASDLHTFMALIHYGPSDIASRLVYLADPEASLRYLGHTTVDRGILDLKPWFGLKIEEYGAYMTSQRHFWVYVYRKRLYGRISGLDWLLADLIATNQRIELKGQNNGNLLLLISPAESPKNER
jgi:hypothetical protein